MSMSGSQAKRHTTYYAPSWSWPSVIGPITFQIGRLDIGNDDQVSHIRKDGILEIAMARQSLLEHIDAHCIADLLNPYGLPKEHASLMIYSPTILATWSGKRDPGDHLAYQSEQILSYRATTSTTSEFAGTLTADFTPDPFWEETLGIFIGDELLLLATILDYEAVRPHKRDGVAKGVKRATVIGLVLAFGAAFPTSSQGGD